MIFDVYDLGAQDANFEPVTALAAGPRRGELVIRKRFYNSTDTSLMAELFRPGTTDELLPSMEYVRVVGMNDRGMVIEGRVTLYARDTHKSRRNSYTVRWLCKAPGAPAVLDTEKLLKRSAARLKARLATSFDPEDDDMP